ncbi:MAG: serine/threonine-protein kinase [Polyangiaceae bacterium]
MLQSFEPGATFAGAYEIVKPLSAGGMGEVFVVRHRDLGELRAMKLMHPQVGRDERLRQKFQQEARIGTRIKSEHIVRVLDVGVDAASGRPWFAMELLEGSDLRSFIDKSGPHPPDTIRKILGQLAHALTAAHRAGIVHRDLKPENIFVAASSRADEAFTLKVLDFGIAKIIAESNTDMSVPIGSPLWMAPEQAEAGSAIGPHTDVWPIGLLAFYLLTGKIFWMAAHVPHATPVQVLQEVMFNPIPPASERAAALGYRFGLPEGFDAWFAQCLSRRGVERFPEAGAAFDRLSAILGARPSMPTMNLPIGVNAAPAMTPARLDQSQPARLHQSQPEPPRVNTTGLVSSQSIPQGAAPKKGTSPVVWVGIAGVLAALGVGGFLMKDKLFGSGDAKAPATQSVAVAKAPETAEKAGVEPPVAVGTTATPAPAPAPTPSTPTTASDPTAEPNKVTDPISTKPPSNPPPQQQPKPSGTPTAPPTQPPPTQTPTVVQPPPCSPWRWDPNLKRNVPNKC